MSRCLGLDVNHLRYWSLHVNYSSVVFFFFDEKIKTPLLGYTFAYTLSHLRYSGLIAGAGDRQTLSLVSAFSSQDRHTPPPSATTPHPRTFPPKLPLTYPYRPNVNTATSSKPLNIQKALYLIPWCHSPVIIIIIINLCKRSFRSSRKLVFYPVRRLHVVLTLSLTHTRARSTAMHVITAQHPDNLRPSSIHSSLSFVSDPALGASPARMIL